MAVQRDEYNGTCVISVQGDFGANEAADIRSAVAACAHRPHIVVDLENCHFLASVGLDALLDTLRACDERGGQLMLAGLDANCRKILEFTRLAPRFNCHKLLPSALKAMA